MKLVDAFIGTSQSKFAAITILIAIIAVCLTILLSKDKIPIGQKFLLTGIFFLLCIPSMLYVLFQMTCIVTGAGGSEGTTWWCGVYAWVLVAFIVIYAIVVVIMAILSIQAGKNMTEVEAFYNNKKVYEKFASDLIQEKKEEHKRVEEPYKVRTEEPMPVDAIEYNAPVSKDDIVLPSVEKFTSCGTEVPKQ